MLQHGSAMSGENRKQHRRRSWEPLPQHSKAPTPVGDALDLLASTMGLASVDGINHLFMAWSDVVGSSLAENCSPKRLSDGVLVVEASDQQWITELSWMTSLIIDRCNDALGDGQVTDVRIVRKLPG